MLRTAPLRRVLASLVATALLGSLPNAFGHAPPDVLEDAARAEIARRPTDPEAHLAAARIHRATGAWDAALAELGRAVELGADPVAVARAEGAVFLDAGWPRMAERTLTRALAARPDDADARYDRARARMALGDATGAARDFADAVGAMPEPHPEHLYAWRDALLALGKRDAALRVLDDGMARLGRVPSLELAALDLELASGRYDAGLARLDALLATSPQQPAWIARRADVLDHLGRADDARRERARALATIESRRGTRRSAAMTALAAEIRRSLGSTTVTKEDRP